MRNPISQVASLSRGCAIPVSSKRLKLRDVQFSKTTHIIAKDTSCKAAEPPRQQGKGKTVVVAGGGPAGLLSALLLANQGFNVAVYEKRPEADEEEKKHGSKSTLLAVNCRGQHSMEQAGIVLPKLGEKSPWHTGERGAQEVTMYFQNGEVKEITSMLPASQLLVERVELMNFLTSQLEVANARTPNRIEVFYGQSLVDLDLLRHVATFQDTSGSRALVAYDLIIGCDGRGSKVREAVQSSDPAMDVVVIKSPRSYKGFHRLQIPRGKQVRPFNFYITGTNAEFNLVWWITGQGTVKGFMVAPQTWFDSHPNRPEAYEELIRSKFAKFPDWWVEEVSHQLVDAQAVPNGGSIKCSKLHGPSAVFLGDAAHSVTPTMGQGCNAALESAIVLAEVIKNSSGAIDPVPEMFTKARLADAHALYSMDRNIMRMNGFRGRNLVWFSFKFHVLMGTFLKRVLPFWFKGPVFEELANTNVQFSRVANALRRDMAIMLSLATLTGVALSLAAKSALSLA